MKLQTIVNAKNSMMELSQKEIGIITAYKIKKILTKIIEESNIFEELRVGLVKKFGEEQEDGMIHVLSENMETYLADLNAILDKDVEFDFEQIKVSELLNIQLKTTELALIEPFILYDLS